MRYNIPFDAYNTDCQSLKPKFRVNTATDLYLVDNCNILVQCDVFPNRFTFIIIPPCALVNIYDYAFQECLKLRRRQQFDWI